MNFFNIEEYKKITERVSPDLVFYIEKNIFPEYEKNDKGHGILHILEVIRRSFELKDSLGLSLDDNMMFAIAACHDNGKYIDHETHEKIAAKKFFENQDFKSFFKDSERKTIKEAIEDHRSSFQETPRSDYGKLISSADRNSTIEIVFIRSFFVGHVRTPDMKVEDFLDFTLNRLRKRYSEEKSENMFFEDEIYAKFLADMRVLLSQGELFKNKYCEVNEIKNREGKLIDEKGLADNFFVDGNSFVNENGTIKVVFGTTNKRKLEDLSNIIKKNNLDIEVLCMADIGWDRGEIDETGTTIEENSYIKAKAILDFCHDHGLAYPIITDDAGLFIDELGGLPGIHTARFADVEKAADPTLPAYESANKIIRLMQGKTNRDCKFRCAVTYMEPSGEFTQIYGETFGQIAKEVIMPAKKPYSYMVFLVENTGKSMYDLSPDEAYKTYRMNALERVLKSIAPEKQMQSPQKIK